jgi:hypothetical protein
MSVNLSRLTRKTTRVRSLFVAILVLGWVFGRVTYAWAQKITPPTTPNALTPPAGNSAFLLGQAVGAMSACPQAQALRPLPGRSAPLAPKRPFLLMSLAGTWR